MNFQICSQEIDGHQPSPFEESQGCVLDPREVATAQSLNLLEEIKRQSSFQDVERRRRVVDQ